MLEDPRLRGDRVRVPRRDIYEKRPVLSATVHPDIKRALVSMSKPILSTYVGDVPLYVHDRKNGYVVPVGDSAQLADRVLKLLREPSLRTKFGRISRDIVQEQLDIIKCGERHLEAYLAVSKT